MENAILAQMPYMTADEEKYAEDLLENADESEIYQWYSQYVERKKLEMRKK